MFFINIILFINILILHYNYYIFYIIFYFISPRRFELLQIPHQEIILPLNYRLKFYFI